MAHIVTCVYCKHKFDRDKYPFVQISQRRFAHPQCASVEDQKRNAEDKDREDLEKFIMELFNTTYVDPKVRKQIKQYVEDYHYTYSGIHKALVYHFDICGGSVEKANGGIGIVPYVYQNAYNYYFTLWQAQQRNADKDVIAYVPKIRHVAIPHPPQRKIRQRQLFTFLDEEEDNSGI